MQTKPKPASSPLLSLRDALSQPASSLITGISCQDGVHDFAVSVSRGLKASPRNVESRFLYDTRGSLLFELITRQPEYYLTRTEASILAKSAGAIRRIAGASTVVELGSGSSEKTDHLLRAWTEGVSGVTYVPVDVSLSALSKATDSIEQRHPRVQVVALNTEYGDALPLVSVLSPAIVIFLGSSIGNFDDREMSSFMATLADSLAPGDFFLGGFDLIKDPSLIEAAYNDAAGVTAVFTRNLFHRMNRELGSGIRVEHVRHRAVYNTEKERIEVDAIFEEPQDVTIMPLGERIFIPKGEGIRTEISRKFRLTSLVPYLESFGLRNRMTFTDPQEWFAIILLQKVR